jgi:HSP20 family protein
MIVDWGVTVYQHPWKPPTDVFETEDKFVVKVEIAGMSQANFSVSYQDGLLSIEGSRADTSERKAFHQMEIHSGDFYTSVNIPSPIVSEKIEAEYSDGFLWVILPKETIHPIKIISKD